MKRPASRWIKQHSQEWMDRTRDLDIRDRCILHELVCLTDIFNGPVPDRPGTICARMVLPKQTWLASRKVLIEKSFVAVTPEGLVIDWALELVKERAERCATNKRVATDREAKRQLQASFEGATDELEASNATPTGEQQRQSNNEINGAKARNVQRPEHHLKNHHHQTQNPEQEKDLEPSLAQPREQASGEGGSDFSDSISIDDDDQSARPLPASLVRALDVAVGEERSAELVGEYLSSRYGRNRQHDGAFVKWLDKTYRIQISARGSTYGPRQLGEICGLDSFGNPETSLVGAKAALARRRSAGQPVAPVATS